MENWRDISTAPKAQASLGGSVGPLVLLSDGSGIYLGFWNGRTWDDGDFFDDLGEMTHWMEVPPLPEATTSIDLDSSDFRAVQPNG